MSNHHENDSSESHESHMREFYEEHSRMANFQRDDSLAAALKRQWGAAPWYLSSFLVHVIIFGLFLLFAPEPKPPVPPKISIQSDIIEPIVDKIEEVTEVEIKKTDNVEDVKIDTKFSADMNISTEITMDTVVDLGNAEQDNSAAAGSSDFSDFGGGSGELTMGVPADISGNSGRSKGKFANRTGTSKKRILRQNKVSRPAQSALDKGLEWLAKTQESNGSWKCSKHGGLNHDLSVTALAQLAFLGAGNSSKFGKYRKNVRAAEKYLLSNRDASTGRIGKYQYEAAITMMAVAESWAMSEDAKMKKIVQGQVDDAVKFQSTNGGWGYKPLLDPTAAHVDTSVAGWWAMGLKSAKVAGAKVPDNTWNNAKKYFRSVTKTGKNGVITSGYIGPGESSNLTAVGLTCLQFLGLPRTDELVKGQAEYFFQNQDRMINANYTGGSPYYGWYYQALGLFQMGSTSKYWNAFNKNMQKTLVSLQIEEGKNKGAWPLSVQKGKEPTHFESRVGMVGTTAISCLMLEVFYRYEDVHHRK